MNLRNKGMFPKEIFAGYGKKDGWIAIGVWVYMIVVSCVVLYILKDSELRMSLYNGSAFAQMMLGILIGGPELLGVLLIMKLRGEKLKSVGIRRLGLKSSLIIGGGLVVIFYTYYFMRSSFHINVIYNSIFYIFLIGFHEEVIYRGYLWPRLVGGFGKGFGTVIGGILFGLMHIPMDIVWNGKSLFETVILGQTTNANVLAALLVTFAFGYIYTRNKNIVLPSIIHALVDMVIFF